MEIRQLQYFLALVQQEHVSNAANLLNISQPALSRSIAALEQELGIPLFDRYGNRIRLNDNGKDFAIYAQQALDILQHGVNSARQTQYDTRGCIRISCHAFADNILPCIDAYTELNPLIQIRLFQSTLGNSHIEDKVDFILSSDMEAQMLTADNHHWISQRLWSEDLAILISPAYRQYPEDVTELALYDLREELFIGSLLDIPEDLTTQFCSAAGFAPRYYSLTDDFLTNTHFVGTGKAIMIIPGGCVSLIRRLYPDIRVFRIKQHPHFRDIYMLRKKDSLMGEAGMDFWEFLLDYYHVEKKE